MILGRREVSIPSLVRIKTGALDRVGIYLQRAGFRKAALIYSDGLPEELTDRLRRAVGQEGIELSLAQPIRQASREEAASISTSLPHVECLLGLGGGKALDTAKYIGFLARKPTLSIPTSLSNDGFCSPLSSLTVGGKRTSLTSRIPSGVVVDTEVCLHAPKSLWLSGIGDLVSKVTAVRDWKLAFHQVKTPVDDFAALLSDASAFQFMGRPKHDLEGMRLLATALMLNGVAMSICGSSRPASGSEHLISHALDASSARPRLHGLQVGIATFLISHLHGVGTKEIRSLFTEVGFWEAIVADPFSRREWRKAIELAPSMKADFFTVLSQGDQTETLMNIVENDTHLQRCFVD
jgi:glycerol-1-phosphate dehydrogenase [NAD(P)+]